MQLTILDLGYVYVYSIYFVFCIACRLYRRVLIDIGEFSVVHYVYNKMCLLMTDESTSESGHILAHTPLILPTIRPIHSISNLTIDVSIQQ